MIDNDIIAYLKTKPAVTDIIGLNPLKFSFDDVPREMGPGRKEVSPPYAIANWSGGDDVRTMQQATGSFEVYFTISAVAKVGGVAKNLYMALRDALGFAGGTSELDVWGSMPVHRSSMPLPQDVSDAPTDGSAVGLKIWAGTLYIHGDYPTPS